MNKPTYLYSYFAMLTSHNYSCILAFFNFALICPAVCLRAIRTDVTHFKTVTRRAGAVESGYLAGWSQQRPVFLPGQTLQLILMLLQYWTHTHTHTSTFNASSQTLRQIISEDTHRKAWECWESEHNTRVYVSKSAGANNALGKTAVTHQTHLRELMRRN